jgi:hypothetical protein
MKTLEDAKRNALQYLQSDIDVLSEQNEDSERRAFHHRAQASLGTIKAAQLISHVEYVALGEKIGNANTISSDLCKKLNT